MKNKFLILILSLICFKQAFLFGVIPEYQALELTTRYYVVEDLKLSWPKSQKLVQRAIFDAIMAAMNHDLSLLNSCPGYDRFEVDDHDMTALYCIKACIYKIVVDILAGNEYKDPLTHISVSEESIMTAFRSIE